ncbi:uncharacterized protein isoform X9 [Musca autumnalis]|uniref:uncharacterized protein isoform X9 n=1 Tax=Musca autumnalis TaxID=221902 RepID=UPI003CF0DC1D
MTDKSERYISALNKNHYEGELDVFQDPRAYIIASIIMLSIYIIIILLILAWRKCYKPRNNTRDRQANVFTIHDETSRESRYNDIFFIEPNSVEAARIRAQLEKDDKDLPSYEEVMRMTSINPTTTTSAVAGMTASNASVNTTETILSVPPYSEVDPMTSASSSGNATSTAGGTGSSATTTASTRTSQPPPMPAAMVSSSVDITQQSSSIV